MATHGISTDAHSFSIARGYSAMDWQRLDLGDPSSSDWHIAIGMLRERIYGRFFAPVDVLISRQEACNQTFGFAILAIDCLVMETIQGFRKGLADHTGKSRQLFTQFLEGWSVFKSCLPDDRDAATEALAFYKNCRCELLHSGATAPTLRVGTSGKPFAFTARGLTTINRTALHSALKKEFDTYLSQLCRPAAHDLRQHFKTKMDAICAHK